MDSAMLPNGGKITPQVVLKYWFKWQRSKDETGVMDKSGEMDQIIDRVDLTLGDMMRLADLPCPDCGTGTIEVDFQEGRVRCLDCKQYMLLERQVTPVLGISRRTMLLSGSKPTIYSGMDGLRRDIEQELDIRRRYLGDGATPKVVPPRLDRRDRTRKARRNG